MTKLILRNFTIFAAGALAYGSCEVLARGGTHISMGLLGGLSMLFIDFLNGYRRAAGLPAVLIMLAASVYITGLEFVSGVILNLRMNMHIWDYSDMPLNFEGQICAPFTAVWFCLAFVGIIADDFLRTHIFYEPRRRVLTAKAA
ncbi:MAG: hypothetical protein QM689_04615 [Oscillospiraceae bacterium]